MNTKPRCNLKIPTQTCAVYGMAVVVTTPLRLSSDDGAFGSDKPRCRGPRPASSERVHPSADTVSSSRSASVVVYTSPSHIPICASPAAVLVPISLIYRHSMPLLAMFSQKTTNR